MSKTKSKSMLVAENTQLQKENQRLSFAFNAVADEKKVLEGRLADIQQIVENHCDDECYVSKRLRGALNEKETKP